MTRVELSPVTEGHIVAGGTGVGFRFHRLVPFSRVVYSFRHGGRRRAWAALEFRAT
jgi:hypothetical protein